MWVSNIVPHRLFRCVEKKEVSCRVPEYLPTCENNVMWVSNIVPYRLFRCLKKRKRRTIANMHVCTFSSSTPTSARKNTSVQVSLFGYLKFCGAGPLCLCEYDEGPLSLCRSKWVGLANNWRTFCCAQACVRLAARAGGCKTKDFRKRCEV